MLVESNHKTHQNTSLPFCSNLGAAGVAAGNKKLEENITLTEIAQRTAGFSGADLENLMNELLTLKKRGESFVLTCW